MRYQYSSHGFRQNFSGNPLSLPNGIKFIIIVNIVVFILMELSGRENILSQIFGLVPKSVSQEYKIWQTCTYLFMHGGILHIFFNMFVLWIFGRDLEVSWGKNEFLIFYFICGIGSGLLTVVSNPYSIVPIVGASGALFGILVGYGFTFANKIVYFLGYFPLKVKYLIISLCVIDFCSFLSTTGSGISHITHFFGVIIGTVYIFINFKENIIRLWYIKMKLKSMQGKQKSKNNEVTHIKMQVDKLLDKLNDQGWESLTSKEEEFLNRASKRIFDDRPPN